MKINESGFCHTPFIYPPPFLHPDSINPNKLVFESWSFNRTWASDCLADLDRYYNANGSDMHDILWSRYVFEGNKTTTLLKGGDNCVMQIRGYEKDSNIQGFSFSGLDIRTLLVMSLAPSVQLDGTL